MAEVETRQLNAAGGVIGATIGLAGIALIPWESAQENEAARHHLYDLKEELNDLHSLRNSIPGDPVEIQPGAYRFVDGRIVKTQTEITAAETQVVSTNESFLHAIGFVGGAVVLSALTGVAVARAGHRVWRYWNQYRAGSAEPYASSDSDANAG